MAAGPDDIRGLIHSQGARIPHLPRSAAALSWQITAHVSKALSLDPEPGRKPARALGAWDHCLHGKLVFPGAAGCIVTITSGLLAYSLPLFVLLSFLTRGGRFFFIAVLPRYYGEPAIPSAAEAASAPVQWRSAPGEKFAEHQMQRLDRRRHEEFEGARGRFSLHMRIVIARLMMMTRSQIACTS
jgi:hypothetical protein